jgi:hypothetical protein
MKKVSFLSTRENTGRPFVQELQLFSCSVDPLKETHKMKWGKRIPVKKGGEKGAYNQE